MKYRLFHGDLVVWAIFFFLSVISLVEVFSAGSFLALKEGSFVKPLFKQLTFLLLSGGIAWVIHNLPCRWFKIVPLLGYPATIILLAGAMFFGQNLNNGARWLSVAGISFQPSEIAKIVLIVTVALILASRQGENGADKSAFKTILIATLIFCLLIVTQNFSTAVLLFGVVVLMMIVGRVSMRQISLLLGAIAALSLLAVITVSALPKDPDNALYDNIILQRVPTWKARLTNKNIVITPDPKDFVVTDKNRQEVHARIAMARAHGTGLAPGRSIQRDYLSAAYSDFIFAIIGEELGLAGCFAVVSLYIILLIRTGRIASRCERNFPAFLVMGLGLMLGAQAVLNMLVAVGLFPVTGQTLPLISKGGTSTIITGVYFGIILSVSRYARRSDKTPLKSLAAEPNSKIAAAFTKN